MASDPAPVSQGPQPRQILGAIATVGVKLLSCGLCNVGTTIWALGGVGQATGGPGAALPAVVKKDAKLYLNNWAHSRKGTVLEVRGYPGC